MEKNSLFMTKKLWVAVAAVFFACVNADKPYCNLKCWGFEHTKCLHPNSTELGSACGANSSAGLSETERAEILKLHNQLRQRVARGEETRGFNGKQPGARNMQNLEWDDELADIAQAWANQCTFGHDKCRDVERFSVGQNVAFSGKSDAYVNPSFAVNSWYDEVDDFDSWTIKSFQGVMSGMNKVVGHYTQLVWAKTTKIGCGASRYKYHGLFTVLVVCNYGPMGNMIGDSVYEEIRD